MTIFFGSAVFQGAGSLSPTSVGLNAQAIASFLGLCGFSSFGLQTLVSGAQLGGISSLSSISIEFFQGLGLFSVGGSLFADSVRVNGSIVPTPFTIIGQTTPLSVIGEGFE